MTYDEIVSGLRALDEADFEGPDGGAAGMDRLYELTNALGEVPAPERAIPELFAVMERLHDVDLGAPGPLVHTLERMPYTTELVASVRRFPTPLSVWMVNRILNSELADVQRRFYLDLLAAAAEHPGASRFARDDAGRFLAFQTAGSAR